MLLLSFPVRAQTPGPKIILAYDASSETQRQAVAAIQAHVRGLPLEVVVASVERQRSFDLRLAESGALAAARQALGTFYIDVAQDRSLLIFFTEAEGEATLIRRLPPSPQGLRVALEQAAIVVRSLVEALLDGGDVGIAKVSEPAPALAPPGPAPGAGAQPPSSTAATDRSDPQAAGDSDQSEAPPDDPSAENGLRAGRLALGSGAAATSFAADVPSQLGISATAHWLVTPVLYSGARYTIFPAFTLGNAEAEISLRRHPLELLVGYRQAGRLALNVELGVVADRTTRTTVLTTTPLQATSPAARWVVAAGARGGFSWSPWSQLWASLRLGADLVLTPYSFSIDSTQALPAPRRLRPRAELELAVWLW